jgi:hypothetical protein
MKILYIGDMESRIEQIKKYRSITRSFQNVDDFKLIYSEFSGLIPILPVVFYDISSLTFRQSYMLKFVEEFPTTLVCLASEDNIIPTLASRFTHIVKDIHVPDWSDVDIIDLDDIFSSETQYIDDAQAKKLIFAHSPALMPFYLHTQKAKARRKLLQLKVGLLRDLC